MHSLIDRGIAGRRIMFAGHGPGANMTDDVGEVPEKARGYESDGAKDQKGWKQVLE